MLDIKFIRQNSEVVKKAATDKLINVDIDRLLEIDELLRNKNQELDSLKERRNKLSNTIPTLSKKEKQNIIEDVRKLKVQISALEEEVTPLKEEFDSLMYEVPGVPLPEVPIGKTDEENVEIKKVGEIPSFDFDIKDHVELAESLDLVSTS